MGVDFAKAALAAGHAIVATGRNPDAVAKAVGEAPELLVVKLDVTSRQDAEAAVKAAVKRFGRIDVLVNNAANFYGGYFEELTPEQIEHQLATGLIGPMNVMTRAVLPVMRSSAPATSCRSRQAQAFPALSCIFAYAAAKFGLEGWMGRSGPDCTLWHSHHYRQPWVLPHRAAHAGIGELRPTPSLADYADRHKLRQQ